MHTAAPAAFYIHFFERFAWPEVDATVVSNRQNLNHFGYENDFDAI